MSTAIKLTGVIILLLSCIFIGFYKSISIKQRPVKIQKLIDGINILYEEIYYGGKELSEALKQTISSCSFLQIKQNKVCCEDRDLSEEERKLINDFFSNLGKKGKQAECERIIAFKEILTKRQNMAQADSTKKSQLWQTGGICVGIAAAIMMI